MSHAMDGGAIPKSVPALLHSGSRVTVPGRLPMGSRGQIVRDPVFLMG